VVRNDCFGTSITITYHHRYSINKQQQKDKNNKQRKDRHNKNNDKKEER